MIERYTTSLTSQDAIKGTSQKRAKPTNQIHPLFGKVKKLFNYITEQMRGSIVLCACSSNRFFSRESNRRVQSWKGSWSSQISFVHGFECAETNREISPLGFGQSSLDHANLILVSITLLAISDFTQDTCHQRRSGNRPKIRNKTK